MVIDNQQFLHYTATPRVVKRILLWIVLLCFIAPTLMLFLPWQQNVQAMGAVTAFAPLERRQSVDAPVGGVIKQWFVREGARVKEGDPLLEIRDVDPSFKDRLIAQQQTSAAKLKAKQDELQAYQVQLQNLLTVRQAKVAAADYNLVVARQKVVTATENVESAQATSDAADYQVSRMQRLVEEGLVSRREVELAARDAAVALRALNSAKASLASVRAEEKSADANLVQVKAETDASIDASRALISKIGSEVADSQNELSNLEINLSRQQSQLLKAPRAGTVFRLPVNSQSQIISQGQPLLVIIPDTEQQAVELNVSGWMPP